jgi:ADP-ribosyl-[dinitrogen reductase] hydrolase
MSAPPHHAPNEAIAPAALPRKNDSGPDALLLDRALGAYLGLAVGDALGATVEFLTPNEIRHQYGVHRKMVGGGWLKLKPGQVTDDTTMSLALGAAILQANGELTALAAAQAFDQWMRGKPVDIGNTVRRNLIRFRRTGEPEAEPSEHDAGNGAAMRVLPVALAYYARGENETIAASQRQAHVTHHNSLSDAGCETLILMVQDLMAGISREQLKTSRWEPLLARYPCYQSPRRRENPSGFIVETLQAVFDAFFNTDGFEACLVDTVNRGGDADTTGAIVGMLAGACYGLSHIPPQWLKTLDPKIAGECAAQARGLLVNC